MNLVNPNLQKYHDHGFEQVHGWCDTYLFETVDLLSRHQFNRKGGIAEIGVHHGKLFILLNQVVEEQYKSYAIDVYESQALNIDGSGCGSSSAFRENLIKYDVHQGRNTVIIEGDSTDPGLQLDKIIEPGSLRFFSVDGGHTAEHVTNDLQIASKLISNDGIVIVDDILNHWWTGVLEGYVNFIKDKPTLVPIAMGHNKLYMCKISYYKHYFHVMNSIDLNGPKNIGKFFGTDIVRYKYWKQLPW